MVIEQWTADFKCIITQIKIQLLTIICVIEERNLRERESTRGSHWDEMSQKGLFEKVYVKEGCEIRVSQVKTNSKDIPGRGTRIGKG